MPLPPVDYGPQVQADTQGVDAMRQVTAQHEAVLQDVRQLGSVIEGGSEAVVKGILHTQALKATAAVKEKQASTLAFIDSNNYVPKAVLQQRMTPEDYTAWHAGLAAEYQDAQAVPMFTAAGALFDSDSKQAREAAGQVISLPGWREKWGASEQAESASIRERYINRMAADQMKQDQRAQSLTAIDKVVDSAVATADFDTALKMAETNPWLTPNERRVVMEKVGVKQDSFVAQQAMLAGDTDVMKRELAKLKDPAWADRSFPHMNAKQRLDLEHQLVREYGFKANKVAAQGIVDPNVDGETGKPDPEAIGKALAAYNGPDKPGVEKEVKAQMAARQEIFDAGMAKLQRVIWTAGQNPVTGEFSMDRAMQNQDARKNAIRLNQDAPGLLTALHNIDVRQQTIDRTEDKAKKAELKAQMLETSGDNLESIRKELDQELSPYKDFTPAKFDAMLMERQMVEADRERARKAFAAFLKNGAKPDERPMIAVKNEIFDAAKGDETKIKELTVKYRDSLLETAHKFIRENPNLKPDEMSDRLRAFIRSKMLSGKVVGSSSMAWPDDTTRRQEWERSSKYAGKPFKLPDGTLLMPDQQRIRLTKGGVTMEFPGDDAVAAMKDGWK